jgi:type 1 glutamine amidotransferase
MTYNILNINSGFIHPSLYAQWQLRQLLLKFPEFNITFSSSIKSLQQLNKKIFHAVILYLHRQHIAPEELDILDTFIIKGGGLLALHSASASFKKEERYFSILGGRFIGHGPVTTFTVEPCHTSTLLFQGIKAFSIKDELYIHKYDESNTIHFITQKDNMTEPMVWTRHHGKGKVCYIAAGHRATTLLNTSMQAIIYDGLHWVCQE